MLFSLTGIVHLAASCVALISGTMVLAQNKGTSFHKKIGYVYVFSMALLLITSFMIYRVHGTFGVLHWFSVISSVTLVLGMAPLFLKRPKNFLQLHLSFMYWSVIGLYCAFFAEILTRIPDIMKVQQDLFVVFYSLVGIATGITGGIGSLYFKKYKKRWMNLSSTTMP